jgi:hypothetical protein
VGWVGGGLEEVGQGVLLRNMSARIAVKKLSERAQKRIEGGE